MRAGAYADLVLFDPATIADRATFEQPKTPAAGIAHVMVNGRTVWSDGAATGDAPRPRAAARRRSDRWAAAWRRTDGTGMSRTCLKQQVLL